MSAAIAALDYAIGLAEAADAKFHELTGKFDDALHAIVTKLKAVREKLMPTPAFGAAGPSSEPCPCYAALAAADQEEVDGMVAQLREAEARED